LRDLTTLIDQLLINPICSIANRIDDSISVVLHKSCTDGLQIIFVCHFYA